jgi:hypothetical protein
LTRIEPAASCPLKLDGRTAPFTVGLADELTVWLAASVFLPWVLLERWRRRCERRRAPGRDRAARDALRKLRRALRTC